VANEDRQIRSENNLPQVVFLGFAERATRVRDGETDLLKWNVQGSRMSC